MRERSESPATRWTLTAIAILFLTVLVGAPVATVFLQAFEKGLAAYLAALGEPEALAALRLTLITIAIAVPTNVVFGLAAGWALAKFAFPGRSLLLALIDLPLSVSPVIAGMIFVLLFGRTGLLEPVLAASGVKVVFAVPGVVLATLFVTFPLVAREVVPVMQAGGTEEEEAARVLGAGGWRTFFRVTLPSVKWGLFYGALLCNARAMGEFGAVSVVSGHVRGETNTLPLHVEILYNEYNFQAAFAVASLLVILALTTVVAESMVGLRSRPRRRAGEDPVTTPEAA
jgi:sulfate/thiosulfate transport system permease protein